ncbi:hypothetical protein VPH35_055197 [Triticum aestivum]|uniref:Uncharacterized protein n=1 Tax=Triticum aestivum TaxID=4565 RepID=A0A077RZQ0_WHEAT|nr:unnamed protein product [Triticum aestivum]
MISRRARAAGALAVGVRFARAQEWGKASRRRSYAPCRPRSWPWRAEASRQGGRRALLGRGVAALRLRQMTTESQVWLGVAKSHEVVGAGHRARLDQLLQPSCAVAVAVAQEARVPPRCRRLGVVL